MRVFLDIENRGGELFLLVTGPQIPRAEHPVTWTGGGRRLLVAKGTASAVADPAALADAVERGTTSDVYARIAEQREYGQLLFEAAFGEQVWQQLLEAAADDPCLELAIRGSAAKDQADTDQADTDQADTDQAGQDQAALQALRWEALHDGSAFVAAQGAASGTVSVSVVRLVPFGTDAAKPAPAGDGPVVGTAFRTVDRIPRVLFAVGSRLSDRNVRSGAEFMGIMRRLERDGGMIQPTVLAQATRESLRHQLRAVRPDVLHLICHGDRDDGGNTCLALRPESRAGNDDDLVTAQQLLGVFRDAACTPAVTILSACQTAADPAAADPVAGAPPHVNALSFAAQLVAGGVPVVVAMAGDIQDTACRVFTRAVTSAIGHGVPLGKAVIGGRRAAFYNRAYDSADWIMPTIFLADDVPTGVPLFDLRPAEAARTRIHDLGMHLTQDTSVFCGRREFFATMDKLLDGADPLNVLIGHVNEEDKHYGGTRLLRELGARAVRAGVLPILLGPFERDPPTSLAVLADRLSAAILDTRNAVGLDDVDSHIAAANGEKMRPRDLASAIRADLARLIQDLGQDDPVRFRAAPHPQVVLLCHRVDRWQAALDGLIDMLGSHGLKGSEAVDGGRRIPVVMTGARLDALKDGRGGRKIDFSAEFLLLDRLSPDDNEDILAYQCWLLNPPRGTPAYAPRRHASAKWHGRLRLTLELDPVYPGPRLYRWARNEDDDFVSDSDEDLLASYLEALP